MNLNEEDIRRAIKTYQENHKMKGHEMTKLLGMSSTSMYSQYKNGITKELKAASLLTLLFNAKIDLSKFLYQNIEERNEESNVVREPSIKFINCLECISKQKEIDALKLALDAKDELLVIYRGKKGQDYG